MKNDPYVKACQEAMAWLAAKLNEMGHPTTEMLDRGDRIETNLNDPATGISVSGLITVQPDYPRYYSGHPRQAKGIKVTVERRKNPVTYRRTDWKSFPWDKIIQRHLEDLKQQLASRVSHENYLAEEERLRELAKQEVALPAKIDNSRYNPDSDFTYWIKLARGLDGTYDVTLSGHFDLAEVLNLRGILVRAYNLRHPEQPLPLNLTTITT